MDILPKKLLLDIVNEPYNLPAILDSDNVNEFRKKYDDSYHQSSRKSVPNKQMLKMNMKIQMQRQRAMLTGKKKAPPTRPWVILFLDRFKCKSNDDRVKFLKFQSYLLVDEFGVNCLWKLIEREISKKRLRLKQIKTH